MPADLQWGLRSGVSFEWREWNGEHVVFERSSGNLHMLDGATAHILMLLAEEALNQETIVSEMVKEGYAEPQSELTSFVRQAINMLQSLRLVCPFK